MLDYLHAHLKNNNAFLFLAFISILCNYRYKFRLKPEDLAAKNEYQYQASFDSPTTFADVYLPFDSFNAVRRNDVIFSAPKVHKGLVKYDSENLPDKNTVELENVLE